MTCGFRLLPSLVVSLQYCLRLAYLQLILQLHRVDVGIPAPDRAASSHSRLSMLCNCNSMGKASGRRLQVKP